ncbi:MAG: hypothetical protein WCV85_04210 [Patescibacteria group bacterium]|jgi:hypothetical protein
MDRVKFITVKSGKVECDGKPVRIGEKITIPHFIFELRNTTKSGLHVVVLNEASGGFRSSCILQDGKYQLSTAGCIPYVPIPKMDRW